MKQRKESLLRNGIASLLAITLVFTCLIPVKTAAAESQIDSFIARLYRTTLQREPDSEGLTYWSAGLARGDLDGTAAAEAFIASEEMQNKDMTNREYLDIMYTALMDRTSDPGGVDYWLGYLQSGVSRFGVLRQFLLSNEFRGICIDYAIQTGNPVIREKRDENINLTAFIFRQYKEILGRDGEIDGLNFWAEQILNQGASLEAVSGSFVFSDEFASKNYSDEDYLKCLYHAFMGREADDGGLNHWNHLLTSGQKNRRDVFDEFAYSTEFNGIIRTMGLTPSQRPPEAEEPKPEPPAAEQPVQPTPTPSKPDDTKPTDPAPETSNPEVTGPIPDKIELISITSPIAPNADATLVIRGKPNTEYTLVIRYNSGDSTAAGLGKKTSDASGVVSWTWKVGSRTASGTYPATVTDSNGERFIVHFAITE